MKRFTGYLLLLWLEQRANGNIFRDMNLGSFNQNDDGCLSKSEITKFLTKEALDQSIDDADEVAASVDNMFLNLDRDKDACVTQKEMDAHSMRLCKTALKNPQDISEWLRHAAELPHIAEKFEKAGENTTQMKGAVRCKDLRVLIKGNGLMLKEGLGITNPLHHSQALHALHVMLMGLGPTPAPPQLPSCTSGCDWAKINFTHGKAVTDDMWPVHKYTISRWTAQASKKLIVGELEAFDEGDTGVYHDKYLQCGSTYFYQVRSWNSFGCSQPAMLPQPCGTQAWYNPECITRGVTSRNHINPHAPQRLDVHPPLADADSSFMDWDSDGTVTIVEAVSLAVGMVVSMASLFAMVSSCMKVLSRAAVKKDQQPDPWDQSGKHKPRLPAAPLVWEPPAAPAPAPAPAPASGGPFRGSGSNSNLKDLGVAAAPHQHTTPQQPPHTAATTAAPASECTPASSSGTPPPPPIRVESDWKPKGGQRLWSKVIIKDVQSLTNKLNKTMTGTMFGMEAPDSPKPPRPLGKHKSH